MRAVNLKLEFGVLSLKSDESEENDNDTRQEVDLK